MNELTDEQKESKVPCVVYFEPLTEYSDDPFTVTLKYDDLPLELMKIRYEKQMDWNTYSMFCELLLQRLVVYCRICDDGSIYTGPVETLTDTGRGYVRQIQQIARKSFPDSPTVSFEIYTDGVTLLNAEE